MGRCGLPCLAAAARSNAKAAKPHRAANTYMMRIMRKPKPNVRSLAKEASHDRIVSAAARAIRRSGFDGTGVADIMKEAGLTHGAFYAHFPSREAMLAEAAGRACAESAAAAAGAAASHPPGQALAAMLRAYLSPQQIGRASCRERVLS